MNAYSYLFFAQVIATAVNHYLINERRKPPFYAQSFPLIIIIGDLVTIFLPLFFVFAALKSFDYSSLKESDKKLMMIGFNIIIIGIIIASAFISINSQNLKI